MKILEMNKQVVLIIFFLGFISLYGKTQSADTLKNTVAIYYNYHHFDKQFPDDWHIGSVEYKRQTPVGAVLGRINYANRLGKNGFQYEIDAYPRISQKIYLYTNISYSNKMPVFPKWRTGLSLFISLPKAWEVEGGFRQLYFDENIWIGTAGVSKYAGNWLFNVRTFFRPDEAGGNQSYFFNARKYLKTERDYVWFQVGRGVSPDETRNVQIRTNMKLASTKLEAGTYVSLNKRTQLFCSAGWSRDEFMTDIFGNQYFGSIGISQRF